MAQTIIGCGAIHQAPALIASRFGRRVLLFVGARSYRASGAEAAFTRTDRLEVLTTATDFAELPSITDVMRTATMIRETRPDVILAVGGGAVIDIAKAANAIAASDGDPLAIITGNAPLSVPLVPLVAVPTTAGSGSEATHFAVVYVGDTKYSIGNQRMRPALAVLDPLLTVTVPRHVAAASGLDALAHGIESFLAVTATPASQNLASAAIRGVLDHLPQVLGGDSGQSQEPLCRAAHLAGQAIDRTRTAAAHALSYTLTARFGVRHGHAVAMLLGPVLEHASEVTQRDAVDPRGARYVRAQLGRIIELFGAADVAGVRSIIDSLLIAGGLQTRLNELPLTDDDVRSVARLVNAERLGNNPRRCSPEDLVTIVQAARGERTVLAG